MNDGTRGYFPAATFLWPALVAESAGELASLLAREIVDFAIGPARERTPAEAPWATPNELSLKLDSVWLRDFSTIDHGVATLVCAPYALHGASLVDFAPGHSLIAALRSGGCERLFATDWRSATPEMRLRTIDNYLADLNVMVDQLGGIVDLVGLCQGGWMSLVYAACFPTKVRKLAIAGAPIDLYAGNSRLSELARNTPLTVFKELIEIGHGRALGDLMLQLWDRSLLDRETIHDILQASEAIGSPAFEDLESRFRQWEACTVDLPGTYYLQVVEQLFKENRLPTGRFMALGRKVELADTRCRLFLLAARDDEIVTADQLFALERLVDWRSPIRKKVVPGPHLSLFMGRKTLSGAWQEIGEWLARSQSRDAPAR